MQRADGVQPGRRGLREVVAKGGGTGAEESYGAEEHEGAEAHSMIAPPVFRRCACSRADTIERVQRPLRMKTCFRRATRKQVLLCCRSLLLQATG